MLLVRTAIVFALLAQLLFPAPKPGHATILPSPTEVKVRVLEVGICGTDKEICSFLYGTPPPATDHLVIGHESLAEVVEIGPAVRRVTRGDLVVTMVRRPRPPPRRRPLRLLAPRPPRRQSRSDGGPPRGVSDHVF